jgi:hypothetical protein
MSARSEGFFGGTNTSKPRATTSFASRLGVSSLKVAVFEIMLYVFGLWQHEDSYTPADG